MPELPRRSACLQLASEGASAATFRTQEVTAMTAIATSASTVPATIANLPATLPRRRWRRRPRCVMPRSLAGAFALGPAVGRRVVVDDALDEQLVGDDDLAPVAGVDERVAQRDVGDPAFAVFEADPVADPDRLGDRDQHPGDDVGDS